MSLGSGREVFFGNTVRASQRLLTNCIEPLQPNGTIKIIGFGGGHVVTNFGELLFALNLVSNAGGGCIIISANVFIVTQTIVLPANTTIKGCNCEVSVLQAAPTLTGPVVSATNVNFVGLESLKITASDQTVPFAATADFSGCSGVQVNDVQFFNMQNNIIGLRVSQCTEISVKCCKFIGGDDGEGMHLLFSVNASITGCLFKDLLNSSATFRSDSLCVNYLFGNNKINRCRFGGLFNGNGYTVVGNSCLDMRQSDAMSCDGFNYTFSGNSILGSEGNAIGVGSTTKNGTIIGNSVRDCENIGIRVSGPANIIGNTICNSLNQGIGIAVSNSLDETLVKCNWVIGTFTGIVNNSASDEVCIHNNKFKKTYSAAGPINPFDSEVIVIADPNPLTMTVADISKCSIFQSILIQNDASSTQNVTVEYNSGADQFVLTPGDNKVLAWYGTLWVELN